MPTPNQNDESNVNTGSSDNDEPDFLSMSDADLAAYDVTKLDTVTPVETPKNAVVNPDVTESSINKDDEGTGNKDDKDDIDSDPNSSVDSSGDGKQVTPAKKDEIESKADVGEAATTGTEGAKVNEQIDYEAKYKELLQPFKANGRDIQVDSVEDVRALMQMGANYNKKMQALKPSIKIMKLLESNGLLDEQKLSFLIDLEKRDPAAINKLVADSKIDPLDLNSDKAAEYQPKTYAVDERELELDAVLTDLKGSEHYNRTLDVVANKWDEQSKAVIAAHPEVLRVINEHIANGVYDITADRLENERMLGRMKGVSDIEAYKQIADKLYAEGAFVDLLGSGSTTKPVQENKSPAPVKQVAAKLSKSEQDALDAKKRAAGSTKTAAPTGKVSAADFNPLNMSDEEFAKLDKVKLFN
jgi:hypothetical protein